MRVASGLVVAALAGVLGAVAGQAAAASYVPHPVVKGDTGRRHVIFTISSGLVTESSSLAVSTTHPSLVYTANDSGDSATVYVLDASTGDLVGQTTLTGVAAVDVEALAVGTDGSLLVGDIGDNHAERGTVAVYRIDQPGRGQTTATPDAVTLAYADGPRDAESLLYDARTGRMFVVSKLLGGAKLYSTPTHVFSRSRATLTPLHAAPALATDATFLDGYRYAVVRTYFSAVVYRYPSWRKADSFDLPPQPQGESVGAPTGGKFLWVGSEGDGSKVLRVRVPDLVNPRPSAATGTSAGTSTPPTASTETATSEHRELMQSIAWRVVVVAGSALVLVVGLGLWLYRRHRQLL